MEDIQQWLEVFVESSTLLIMFFSLVGLIIPIFPGIVIIWIMALLNGIVFGFGIVGWLIFAVLTVLMIAGILADNFLMGIKAREKGAAWTSIGLGLLAGIVFTLIVPPIGGIIAAPLTLFVLESRRQGDRDAALETVKALMIGWGWSFVARFGIGVVMVVLWGIWALQN